MRRTDVISALHGIEFDVRRMYDGKQMTAQQSVEYLLMRISKVRRQLDLERRYNGDNYGD